MMRSVFFGLILISLLTVETFSQDAAKAITGQLLDSESCDPIGFAHVFVMGLDDGTVTDINGAFHLPERTTENKSDTLRFSAIGYETVFMTIDSFLSGAETIVYLKPLVYEGEQVTIRASRLKRGRLTNRNFWIRTFGSQRSIGGFSPTPVENITYINAQQVNSGLNDPFWITKIKVYIGSISESKHVESSPNVGKEQFILRLRIKGHGEDENPGEDLLLHDVRKAVPAKRQILTFDLEEYDVLISDPSFFFVIELLVPDLDRFHGKFPLYDVVKGPNPFKFKFRTYQKWGSFTWDNHELGYEIHYEM